MDLYFSPLSCSLATRIALYEAGAAARYVEVDPKTKRTSDGLDYRALHPLGLVPALRTDQGELLTENAAVLQYIGRRFPEAELLPRDELELARLQQWLCFIGTELHKGLFVPLLDEHAPQATKSYVREKYLPRFSHVEQHLTGRSYLLDRFSVADAYLSAVLNWTKVTAIDLENWPVLHAYGRRLRERPSIARALGEELALYQQAQASMRASRAEH
ncbi:MAG: glutathione S-transferase [Myxococcaceae bacterium]|nr:glutathione S-transferase [Myxococcaceae bacterium]